MSETIKRWFFNPIFTLVMILAVTFLASNFAYYWLIKSESYNYRQIENFKNVEMDPTVVIFGDSRVAFGLSNRILTSEVVNLAGPGENLRQTLIKLMFVLEEKRNVETILIATDHHITAEYRELQGKKTIRNLISLVKKEHIMSVFSLSEFAYYKALLVDFIPLLSNEKRFEFSNAVLKMASSKVFGTDYQKAIFIDECGDFRRSSYTSWNFNDPVKKINDGVFEVKRKFHSTVFTEELHQVLDEILQLAEKNGIKIVGFTTPQTVEYTNAAEKTLNENSRVSQKIGLHTIKRDPRFMQVIDFNRIFEMRPELFENADHLNPEGAKEFSRVIMDQIRLLGLVKDSNNVGSC